MKKILLVGNYGAGNFGDDLLYLAIRNSLSLVGNFELKVMCPGSQQDFPLPPAGIRSLFSFNFVKAISAIKNSDVVVFGGGGLFNPEEWYSLFIWGQVVIMAKFFKKPVYLMANSFSPKFSSFLKLILSNIDLISVRDSLSRRNLAQYSIEAPVRTTSDLALLLDSAVFDSKIHVFDHDKFIVLNLRDYPILSTENLVRTVCQIIDYVLKNSCYAVYLLPFDSSDIVILKQIQSLYSGNGKVFLVPFEKRVCYAAISKCSGVVSTRLHVGISGVLCHKPLFVLSYSSKVSGFFSDLLSPLFIASFDDDCTEIDNSLASFVECVDRNKLNYDLLDVEALKKKSNLNIRLLNDFG